MVDIMVARDAPLSELVDSLPQYKSSKTKVPVPPEKKDPLLNTLLEITKDEPRITLDGVKLQYDEGWILMRPSGTEPLWRCFAEARSQEIADELCAKGVAFIKDATDKT